MKMQRTRRLASLLLLVLTIGAVLAAPAEAVPAPQSPPPGPVNGSGP